MLPSGSKPTDDRELRDHTMEVIGVILACLIVWGITEFYTRYVRVIERNDKEWPSQKTGSKIK